MIVKINFDKDFENFQAEGTDEVTEHPYRWALS